MMRLTAGEKHERLFVVTPDLVRPVIIDSFDDDRVIWFNFRAMSDAIDEILNDNTIFVGEQTRFLLGELQQLFAEDGLLDIADTVIVAARFGWDEYRGLTHMGFYAHGAIQTTVAKILDQRPESITFDSATVEALRTGSPIHLRIADAIEASLEGGTRSEGQPFRVFVLSRNSGEGSVELAGPIANTTKALSGRTFAWTMSQRYTRLTALTTPGIATTSDLEAAGG
jgi:hypothetical protein